VTGTGGQRIVAAIEELSAELGSSEELSAQSRRWAETGRRAPGQLDAGDEELIVRLRAALARLAAAARAGEDGVKGSERAVTTALDGAELVMRGEILLGNGDRISDLVPSFAFLATLPMTGKQRALTISRRATELLEEAET
jgi:hypothetical protein